MTESHSRGYKLPQSVLVIIHSPCGQVLLIRRVDSGTWQSVTGSKDRPDESYWDTAVREVREETGLDTLDVVAPAGTIGLLLFPRAKSAKAQQTG